MSMEEAKKRYKSFMKAVSLLKALGIIRGYDVVNVSYDHDREGFEVVGDLEVPRAVLEKTETLVDELFREMIEYPTIHLWQLEGLAEDVKENFEKYRRMGWNLLDYIVYSVMFNALAVLVADMLSIRPDDVDRGAIQALTNLLHAMFRHDEELKDTYEYWRLRAGELRQILKEKGLL